MTLITEQQFHDVPASTLARCLNSNEPILIGSSGFLRPTQGERLALVVPLERFPDLADAVRALIERRSPPNRVSGSTLSPGAMRPLSPSMPRRSQP